jgi:hypothetical protein
MVPRLRFGCARKPEQSARTPGLAALAQWRASRRSGIGIESLRERRPGADRRRRSTLTIHRHASRVAVRATIHSAGSRGANLPTRRGRQADQESRALAPSFQRTRPEEGIALFHPSRALPLSKIFVSDGTVPPARFRISADVSSWHVVWPDLAMAHWARRAHRIIASQLRNSGTIVI